MQQDTGHDTERLPNRDGSKIDSHADRESLERSGFMMLDSMSDM